MGIQQYPSPRDTQERQSGQRGQHSVLEAALRLTLLSGSEPERGESKWDPPAALSVCVSISACFDSGPRPPKASRARPRVTPGLTWGRPVLELVMEVQGQHHEVSQDVIHSRVGLGKRGRPE